MAPATQLLAPGQKLMAEMSGLPCRVEQFLGGGGQGEVYRATMGGADVALKWYFPASATARQRTSLEKLAKNAPPDQCFLWPMDLVSGTGIRGFGYVMPLRPARFKSIVDLMKRRIEPTFRTLATAGLHLSNSYLLLHSRGLCYRDISFGNAFFDPINGEVLICDNDNVTVNGDAAGGILGTPRFMAPEVVRGEAPPSTQTDLFSLAVLLFYIFMVHHPLEGKKEAEIRCLDLPAMTRLYGTQPLFIFDPKDQSNAPVPGYHSNALAFWPIYPEFLRTLFTRAFTEGIRDPVNGRVRESEWRAAMARLSDSIVYCAKCSAQNFFDPDVSKSSSRKIRQCWSCNQDLQHPLSIWIGNSNVILNYDTQLFRHHLDPAANYDFAHAVAAVTRHPTDPHVWGLKNLSQESWTITTVEGSIREVAPGKSLTLTTGTRIRFGTLEGEIRS